MKPEIQKTYRYQEFPRVVYGQDGSWMTINSEAERPEGYTNAPGEAPPEPEPAPEAKKTRARRAEKPKDDHLRAEYVAFLDKHKVVYAEDSTTEQLAALAQALAEHLERVGE